MVVDDELKKRRTELRLSQSELARLSGVSRIKICLHELGDRPLTANEEDQIEAAIRKELRRVQQLAR